MVDSGELERLRAEAANRGHRPMARLARALYEAGLPPEQVLRECYGVDLPREVFVIAKTNPYTLGLLAKSANQPPGHRHRGRRPGALLPPDRTGSRQINDLQSVGKQVKEFQREAKA